jgi:hypothetical protein
VRGNVLMDVGGKPSRWPHERGASAGSHTKTRLPAARRWVKAWALLALAGLVSVLAAACGGGSEPEAEGSPTPPPAGEDGTLPPCEAFRALETYRYTVDVTLESPEPSENPPESQSTPTSSVTDPFTEPYLFEYDIDASFVAPDRIQALITSGWLEEPFGMIDIGGQVWMQTGVGKEWRSFETGVPYKPFDICEGVVPILDLSLVEPQQEKVNEVETLHYSFSQVSSEQALAKIFGETSDMTMLIKTLDVELWLAEKGGWPARLDIVGSGLYSDGRELRAHVLLDVRDANSDDIRVEPPS